MTSSVPAARILTISGSLRAVSSNTALLRALARVAPEGVEVTLFEELGELPHFNPDLDEEGAEPPPPVGRFRERVAAADAVAICSPEYAHGVPGVLKDALDWLVSGVELSDKPLALLNASPYSTYARDSLAETLRTMGALLVEEASITVPLRGRKLDAEGIAAEPEIAGALRSALESLLGAVEARRARG